MKKPLLMIPGPCEVHEEVLAEMSRPLVPHYGRQWAEEYNETRVALRQVFETEEDIFLTVASGHAAVEAAVNSLAVRGEKLLVVENGFFGERISWIAHTLGIETIPIKEEWGMPIVPEMVEQAVKNNPEVNAIALVHGETSTGVLNPIEKIGRIAKKYDLLLFVDAVCSIGATEFMMDQWGVDICVTASQKGLSAPPGLAIAAFSKKAWNFINSRTAGPAGWYLNPKIWREFDETQRDFQPYGITMTVNNVRALRASLNQMFQEGLAQRYNRHRAVSQQLREGLAEIGLKVLAKAAFLPLITAVRCPEGHQSQEIVDFLREKHHIYISGGLGAYKESTFRIGHMGLGADPDSVESLLCGLKDCLKHI